ncbi:MAG: hypothetical protein GY797_30500 [Deltaproteobacteria bacterium]|nr:hypothetical protein [Deltaproteobacteria bacterium]
MPTERPSLMASCTDQLGRSGYLQVSTYAYIDWKANGQEAVPVQEHQASVHIFFSAALRLCVIFQIGEFQIPLTPFAKGGKGMDAFFKVGIAMVSFPKWRKGMDIFKVIRI